jgi:hypothetical protein
VSPLTTRTKIAVGVGLVVCAALVLLLLPPKPAIALRFVSYEDHRRTVRIGVTNQTGSELRWSSFLVWEKAQLWVHGAPQFWGRSLLAFEGCEVLVPAPGAPVRFCVRYQKKASGWLAYLPPRDVQEVSVDLPSHEP